MSQAERGSQVDLSGLNSHDLTYIDANSNPLLRVYSESDMGGFRLMIELRNGLTVVLSDHPALGIYRSADLERAHFEAPVHFIALPEEPIQVSLEEVPQP